MRNHYKLTVPLPLLHVLICASMNTDKEVTPRLAWGIKEAAEAICASTGFIRKAIDGNVPGAPRLKSVKVGSRTLILDRDFKEWIGITNPSR